VLVRPNIEKQQPMLMTKFLILYKHQQIQREIWNNKQYRAAGRYIRV